MTAQKADRVAAARGRRAGPHLFPRIAVSLR